MARIAGIDIPREKRVVVALTYIVGIGRATSEKILNAAGIDHNIRVKDLDEAAIAKIRDQIAQMDIRVEGEIRRIVSQNVRRLQEIKSYRGLRHKNGLPTRGQRTRSNARTRKGKKRTVAKKKIAKK